GSFARWVFTKARRSDMGALLPGPASPWMSHVTSMGLVISNLSMSSNLRPSASCNKNGSRFQLGGNFALNSLRVGFGIFFEVNDGIVGIIASHSWSEKLLPSKRRLRGFAFISVRS